MNRTTKRRKRTARLVRQTTSNIWQCVCKRVRALSHNLISPPKLAVMDAPIKGEATWICERCFNKTGARPRRTTGEQSGVCESPVTPATRSKHDNADSWERHSAVALASATHCCPHSRLRAPLVRATHCCRLTRRRAPLVQATHCANRASKARLYTSKPWECVRCETDNT